MPVEFIIRKGLHQSPILPVTRARGLKAISSALPLPLGSRVLKASMTVRISSQVVGALSPSFSSQARLIIRCCPEARNPLVRLDGRTRTLPSTVTNLRAVGCSLKKRLTLGSLSRSSPKVSKAEGLRTASSGLKALMFRSSISPAASEAFFCCPQASSLTSCHWMEQSQSAASSLAQVMSAILVSLEFFTTRILTMGRPLSSVEDPPPATGGESARHGQCRQRGQALHHGCLGCHDQSPSPFPALERPGKQIGSTGPRLLCLRIRLCILAEGETCRHPIGIVTI